MRRLLAVAFAALLAAVLLPPVAPAAPVPKHLLKDRPTYYHPTTVGTRWVYDSYGNEVTYVVTGVEDYGDTKLVTVEWDVAGKRGAEAVVEVSPKGLFRTHSSVVKLVQPDIYLKQPFKAGDTWDYDNPGMQGKDLKGREVTIYPFKGTATIAGVETVKVPAGTFTAVRVNLKSTRDIDGKQVKSEWSHWYAPNVGRVKVTGENDHVITQLKSFTPGRE